MKNPIDMKTQAEVCDRIQELITEQGWHFASSPNGSSFVLVAPFADARSHMCSRWKEVSVFLPDVMFREEPCTGTSLDS